MSIRPTSFDAFHGQADVIAHLKIAVKAAIRMKRPLGHLLLSGPPGLGKTTIGAWLVPSVMGTIARIVNCSSIEKASDLLPTVSTMKAGEILFLDEIHALPAGLKETLYTVMEDFHLPIVIGDDSNRQILNAELPPFTIVGATTREGLLPIPMLDRFKHQLRLDLYSDSEMVQVLQWTAEQLKAELSDEAAALLVAPCHGTARHAGRLLEACVETVVAAYLEDSEHSRTVVDVKAVKTTLKRLKYSKSGLSDKEVKLLQSLAKAPSGTLSLSTLSSVLNDEEVTIQEVYEPWLLQQNYIVKTSRGRALTPHGATMLQQEQPWE